MINEIIRKRRSVRMYTNEIIAEDYIHSIIEAGMWAPTACNKQDYRFIYFDNNEQIMEIYNLGSAHFLKNCSQAILVLYYNNIDNVEYHDDILTAGMVIQNMALQAADLGIGNCVIANLPSKKRLRKHLSIPKYYDPMALISLGYPQKNPAEVKRHYQVEDVTHTNKFDVQKDSKRNVSTFKMSIRRLLRKIYIRLPKTRLLKKMVDKFEKKFDN